ncbi:hypothetical protein [Alkalihalobacillus sp. BA299]|uniref:hypothetical protein n=1 Tax=Alkalihalobacillus sp. BA299 TaxID=2815938 RepID=UPI001ADC5AFB|nr:hypothetical protein [Alkalihalobacillus sp. BA299]
MFKNNNHSLIFSLSLVCTMVSELIEKMIEVFLKEQYSTILVAEKDGRLIGHILAKGGVCE